MMGKATHRAYADSFSFGIKRKWLAPSTAQKSGMLFNRPKLENAHARTKKSLTKPAWPAKSKVLKEFLLSPGCGLCLVLEFYSVLFYLIQLSLSHSFWWRDSAVISQITKKTNNIKRRLKRTQDPSSKRKMFRKIRETDKHQKESNWIKIEGFLLLFMFDLLWKYNRYIRDVGKKIEKKPLWNRT